jgi:type II secretory pathway component PulF
VDYPDRVIRLGFRIARGADGRARLYERIAGQVAYGAAIVDVVESLADRAFKRGGKGDPEGLILRRVAGAMRASGTSFAAAMRQWIPAEEYTLFDAAEESGRIKEALGIAARLDRMRRSMIKEVIGGMVNPLILFAVLYGLLWFLGGSVMGPVVKIAQHVQLSAIGNAVVAMGKITRSWLFAVSPLIFVFLIALALWSLPRWTGEVRKFFDHIPPWSIYRNMQGAIWLSSYAALVGAGMAERDALARLIAGGVPWVVERLRKMRKNMLAGLSSGRALDATGDRFPDQDTIDDMVILADYPDFSEKLSDLSERAIEQSRTRIRASTGLIVALANIAINLVIILVVVGIADILNSMGATHAM